MFPDYLYYMYSQHGGQPVKCRGREPGVLGVICLRATRIGPHFEVQVLPREPALFDQQKRKTFPGHTPKAVAAPGSF